MNITTSIQAISRREPLFENGQQIVYITTSALVGITDKSEKPNQSFNYNVHKDEFTFPVELGLSDILLQAENRLKARFPKAKEIRLTISIRGQVKPI